MKVASRPSKPVCRRCSNASMRSRRPAAHRARRPRQRPARTGPRRFAKRRPARHRPSAAARQSPQARSRAARACRSGWRADGRIGLQPGDLVDPERQLRQPVARSVALPAAGIHPERRRSRSRCAQLLARRVRAQLVGQRRSDVLGSPDRIDHGRGPHRGRGGAVRTPGPVRRRDVARRALPVVDRLSEFPACACLGLLRRAARLPGLLRRADADRRASAEVAGADRSLSSSSVSKPAPGAAFRAPRASATASAPARCSRTSATTSATARAGVPACRTC